MLFQIIIPKSEAKSWKLFSQKCSILDAWQGFEYVPANQLWRAKSSVNVWESYW